MQNLKGHQKHSLIKVNNIINEQDIKTLCKGRIQLCTYTTPPYLFPILALSDPVFKIPPHPSPYPVPDHVKKQSVSHSSSLFPF